MLRDPQHERKIINDFNSPPFVLSYVEESPREFFSNLLVSISGMMATPALQAKPKGSGSLPDGGWKTVDFKPTAQTSPFSRE